MSQTKAQLIDNLVSPITGALGSASAPTFSFTTDPNTGIYSPGADQVAISTNGTQRLTTDTAAVTSTLPVVHPLGAAATPSLTFTGDLNTGIYSPGADQLAVATNGTVRLTTDTAAITSTLPVVHPLGAVGTPSITFTGDLNTGVFSPGADTVALATAGSNRLHITSAGLVGIGTTSPDGNLTIGGLTNTGGESVDAINVNRTDGVRLFGVKWDVTSNEVRFSGNTKNYVFRNGSSEAETARIDSSGRLGIGTTSPSVLTHLSTSTDTQLRVESTSASGTNEAAVQLIRGSNQSAIKNKAGGLEFFVQGLTNEVARIDSSGRLLVGTSTTTGFQSGARHIFMDGGGASYSSVSIGNPGGAANNTDINITAWTGSGSNYYSSKIRQIGDGSLTFHTQASSSTNGAGTTTERMRITSTGQVRLAGAGITFNGDTAAANELDDYEEGTWTPTLTTSGTNFTSVTYLSNSGGYTKIGNTVIAWFFMYTDAVTIGSASGNVQLGGLPFTVNSSASSRSSGALQNVFGWTAGNMPETVGHINGGTKLEIYKRTTAGGAQAKLVPSDVSTGSASNSMHGVFVYRI